MRLFSKDYYFNSPVNNLPLDPTSIQKISALGVGRLGPSPEMILNAVNGIPPGASIQWGGNNPENDGGNYPINPNTQVSQYVFGATQPISGYTNFGADSHIIMYNSFTKILYETYGLSNNVPPYQVGVGAIWDTNEYALRSAVKLIPYGVDSSGLTSADVAGMPIWPLTLTHKEVYSGNPIEHGVRFALGNNQCSQGYQWPATHQGNANGNSGIMLGSTFRLKSDFDSSELPGWFQPTVTMLKTYGLYLTDFGFPGLITTDASQSWGDPGSSTSDNWIFAGLLHQIPFSALEIVENQARIVNVLSGQVKTDPSYR